MDKEEYPVWDNLTQLEQYMLMGVESSDLKSGYGLPPWSDSVFMLVNKFYLQYGYVPEQLTPDIIKMTPGCEQMADDEMAVYSNPLTGEWPLLQAKDQSVGNVYIRPLTEDEINYFVDHGETYLRQPTEYSQAGARTSPVYYMRVYGLQGVLLNGFYFISEPK